MPGAPFGRSKRFWAHKGGEKKSINYNRSERKPFLWQPAMQHQQEKQSQQGGSKDRGEKINKISHVWGEKN